MLSCAIYMYYAKYKKCTIIPIILFVYILGLFALVALDMTQQYIAGFFLLIYMANLFNFIGFRKILDNLRGEPREALKEKTRHYFTVMYVLYALTLFLAFFPRFGPYCQAEKVYPPCMNWTACLFIINFIFHLVISSRKDYFFHTGSILIEPR